MSALLTDPSHQPGGEYLLEEEAEQMAQQLLESQFAEQSFRAALACLQLAEALLESNEYDGRSALIQAGVTETADPDLQYLHDVGRRFIPQPGYLAWQELRGIVIDRVGIRELGMMHRPDADPDAWYAHVQVSDIRAAISNCHKAIDEILDPQPLAFAGVPEGIDYESLGLE